MTKSDILHFGILIVFSFAVGIFFWRYSENIIQNTAVVVAQNGVSNSLSSSIKIKDPVALSQVASPVFVSGKALGLWFFEGVFPVKVIDEDGNTLGTGMAQASAPSMVNGFVPFDGTVTFSKGDATAGFLLFQQNNPSGIGDVRTSQVPVNFDSQSFSQNP